MSPEELEGLAKAVARLRDGDFAPPGDEGTSEAGKRLFGLLAEAAAQLTARADRAKNASAEMNARLENVVRARTAALGTRTRQMRAVLDNVSQGLLKIDKAGTIALERSAVVDRWFGAPAPQMTIWAYLARVDRVTAGWVEASWSMLDGLPPDVALGQIPSRISAADGRVFNLEIRPILDGETFVEALVVIDDVTEAVRREASEAQNRDALHILESALADRGGFMDFATEGQDLVDDVTGHCPEAMDLVMVKRSLHTLKGITAQHGLRALPSYCHEVEERMLEEQRLPTFEEKKALNDLWSSALVRTANLLSRDATNNLSVPQADVVELIALAEMGSPAETIASKAKMMMLERVFERVGRLGATAEQLATRLGREIAVSVVADDLRYDAELWTPFWASLAHVVRNAIDHGIESPEAREEAGKPRVGKLQFRARSEGSDFVLEVEDDGKGIDWSTIAVRAEAAGLPCETHADLIEALFADGVSSRSEASETSGRGVGAGATREACKRLGGRIEIDTVLGAGTTFRFVFPKSALAEAYQHEPPQSGSRTVCASDVGTPGIARSTLLLPITG